VRGNAQLVFDPGNQFGSLVDIAPYFGIPGWWRPFLFRVLSQRDLTIYVYLCSLMDRNDICYPTSEQIREEVGVDSPTTVFSALRNLEVLGFLLRRRKRLPGRTYKFQRNIYQRPAPEFTLLTLLDQNVVNGQLRPLNPATKKPYHSEAAGRLDSVIDAGLRRLLGDKHVAYLEATEDEKAFTLRVLLQERLDDRRAEFGPIAQTLADESKADTGVIVDGKRYRTREIGFVDGQVIVARSAAPIADELPNGDDEIPF
jgi:hypothetical protein